MKRIKITGKSVCMGSKGRYDAENINQVNRFVTDMVKEKNFQRIVIANDQGVIISSTNKKDEGQPFATVWGKMQA